MFNKPTNKCYKQKHLSTSKNLQINIQNSNINQIKTPKSTFFFIYILPITVMGIIFPTYIVPESFQFI